MLGKKRKFVIMDGSDVQYVNEIKGLSKMVIGRFKRIKIRKIDRDHPTMKVVTIRSGYRKWSELRKIIERDHSEQCIFDAPL
jgi:hypothetical protein